MIKSKLSKFQIRTLRIILIQSILSTHDVTVRIEKVFLLSQVQEMATSMTKELII